MPIASGKKKISLVIGGVLALALGAFTLSPTDGDNSSVSGTIPYRCKNRFVEAVYPTAGVWTPVVVCEANEYAFASGGQCPANGYMKGSSLSFSTLNNTFSKSATLLCSTSGIARWDATCCQLMNEP